MMNALGSCIGTIGMIPCCPCPNPFKEVAQGSVGKSRATALGPEGIIGLTDLGLISRFGQFYKSVDPGLVKVNVCSEQVRIVGESYAISQ